MAQNTQKAAAPRTGKQDYPEDRFDRLGRRDRVGAHRVTARPRYVWQYLLAGLLGFAVLTGLGILGVHAFDGAGKLPINKPGSGSTAKQPPQVKVDPEATIAILNGTDVQGLAAKLEGIVTEKRWGKILFSGPAATSDVKISAVFYSDPADAEAAAGLASKLGGISTYTTTDYADYQVRLVVLLGADYQGPGRSDSGSDPSSGQNSNSGSRQLDPVTGWEIDPETGLPIDPATGLPTDPATLNPGTAPQ